MSRFTIMILGHRKLMLWFTIFAGTQVPRSDLIKQHGHFPLGWWYKCTLKCHENIGSVGRKNKEEKRRLWKGVGRTGKPENQLSTALKVKKRKSFATHLFFDEGYKAIAF